MEEITVSQNQTVGSVMVVGGGVAGMQSALDLAKKLEPIVLSKKPEEQMLLDRVPEKFANDNPFTLER